MERGEEARERKESGGYLSWPGILALKTLRQVGCLWFEASQGCVVSAMSSKTKQEKRGGRGRRGRKRKGGRAVGGGEAPAHTLHFESRSLG